MDSEQGGGDRRTAVDAGLALLIATVGVVEVLAPLSTLSGTGDSRLGAALVLLSSLPLAFRRRFPVPVLMLTVLPSGTLGLFTDVLVPFWGGLVPISVAAYSVTRHGRRRDQLVGLLALVVGIALMRLGNEALRSVGNLVFPSLVILVSWTGGLMLARAHRVADAHVHRAAVVEARSREDTLLAIAEERARIARELHDVVAHAVTSMVVTAGAAGQIVDEDPAYARHALEQIRTTGSRALAEMREVVSLLRTDGELSDLAPQPGLRQLPALVAASETSVTRVQLSVEGEPRPLTAGKDLAAYRIVQEALTNAHRHARASRVMVSVAYGTARLRIDVRDDGIGRQATNSPGHGLIGMRERAAAHGGDAEFLSRDGFLVRAWLPLDDS